MGFNLWKMEFLNFYEMKVVTVGPDTDHDYFAGTEGRSRVDSLREATTKDASGTADSSWTTVRTVGGTKKSLCRIKGHEGYGYAVNLRILVGHGADHENHEGNAVTEGENAGITVRTVGIATDGRYCWNQGNLRILVGHGADHEYHEGNAVTEREKRWDHGANQVQSWVAHPRLEGGQNEETHGPTHQAVIILNKESLAPIDAAGVELGFGFSSVFIRVYKSDAAVGGAPSDKPVE
ncbi:hypothetical protein ACLKA7_014663 [Drosophila subpalustris]